MWFDGKLEAAPQCSTPPVQTTVARQIQKGLLAAVRADILSLDLSRMEDSQKRPDKDYAVSWVRAYVKGRVFYTTLGHDATTYWNPVFLKHLLAGVQFAIGDLEGERAPVAAEA